MAIYRNCTLSTSMPDVSSISFSDLAMPSSYLLPHLPPVLNQSWDTESATAKWGATWCGCAAAVSIKLWQERGNGHCFLPFDGIWLNAKAASYDNLNVVSPNDLKLISETYWQTIPSSQVGSISSIFKVLLFEGLALQNNPEVASLFRISNYEHVIADEDLFLSYSDMYYKIKQAVYQHGPVWVAFNFYANFFSIGRQGIFSAPIGDSSSGHGAVVYGWDDSVNGGSLILRNSWGKNWGLDGNFYGSAEAFVPTIFSAIIVD
jgi:hypothetical protein